MNLHLMLILLSFQEPKIAEPLQLIDAPQVVAPTSLYEDQHTLQEMRELNKMIKELQQQAYKPYIYWRHDKRRHVVWSELV